jgi:hypothetical protein
MTTTGDSAEGGDGRSGATSRETARFGEFLTIAKSLSTRVILSPVMWRSSNGWLLLRLRG